MRVISQNNTVDIDYDSSCFWLEEVTDKKENYYRVTAKNNNQKFCMGIYHSIDLAKLALVNMSAQYTRYMISHNNNTSVITDCLVYDLDKTFERFELREIHATSYHFPNDDI